MSGPTKAPGSDQSIPDLAALEGLQAKVPNASSVGIRPRSHNNPGMLDLDQSTLQPGFHYRWVRCRADEHGSTIIKRKLQGYKPVTTEEGVVTLAEPDKRPDKVIGIGDMILMKCPAHLVETRRLERRQLNEARMNATTAVTKQAAKEKGVRVIEDSE